MKIFIARIQECMTPIKYDMWNFILPCPLDQLTRYVSSVTFSCWVSVDFFFMTPLNTIAPCQGFFLFTWRVVWLHLQSPCKIVALVLLSSYIHYNKKLDLQCVKSWTNIWCIKMHLWICHIYHYHLFFKSNDYHK